MCEEASVHDDARRAREEAARGEFAPGDEGEEEGGEEGGGGRRRRGGARGVRGIRGHQKAFAHACAPTGVHINRHSHQQACMRTRSRRRPSQSALRAGRATRTPVGKAEGALVSTRACPRGR